MTDGEAGPVDDQAGGEEVGGVGVESRARGVEGGGRGDRAKWMGPYAEAPNERTGIGAALAGRAVSAMPPTTPSELAADRRRKIRFIAVPVRSIERMSNPRVTLGNRVGAYSYRWSARQAQREFTAPRVSRARPARQPSHWCHERSGELPRAPDPGVPLRSRRHPDRQRVPARDGVARGAAPAGHRPVRVAHPPADRDERRAVSVRADPGDRAGLVRSGHRDAAAGARGGLPGPGGHGPRAARGGRVAGRR